MAADMPVDKVMFWLLVFCPTKYFYRNVLDAVFKMLSLKKVSCYLNDHIDLTIVLASLVKSQVQMINLWDISNNYVQPNVKS